MIHQISDWERRIVLLFACHPSPRLLEAQGPLSLIIQPTHSSTLASSWRFFSFSRSLAVHARVQNSRNVPRLTMMLGWMLPIEPEQPKRKRGVGGVGGPWRLSYEKNENSSRGFLCLRHGVSWHHLACLRMSRQMTKRKNFGAPIPQLPAPNVRYFQRAGMNQSGKRVYL